MFKSQYFSTKEDKDLLVQIMKDLQSVLKKYNASITAYKSGFELTIKETKNDSNTILYGEFLNTIFLTLEEPKIIKFIKRKE